MRLQLSHENNRRQVRGRNIICPPGHTAGDGHDAANLSFPYSGYFLESFLDLYSGSGIIGIEAASRGASPVFLVEKDAGKKLTIYKNISFVTEDIKAVIMPVERFIRMQKIRFDLFSWTRRSNRRRN